jgi:ribose transport system substrate-binding protein
MVPLLVLCLALPAVAVAKDIKIGLSMKQQNAPYFVALVEASKQQAAAMGVTFYVTDAQGNISKQISDVDDLLAKGIDAIIIDAVDPLSIVPATKAATRAKVPVIAVDTTIDNSGDFITLIQSNNLENGRKVGEYVGGVFGSTPIKAALISGAKGNIPGRDRRTGVFIGIMEEQLRTQGKAQIEVVAQGWGNWGQEDGLKAMEDILVAHPDINLLITENDSMALGALKAIQEAGKSEQIRIAAACDGQKEGIEMILNGKGNYLATGVNNPAVMGRMGVEAAVTYVKTGKIDLPKIYFTEPVAVTKDNAKKYYDPKAIF